MSPSWDLILGDCREVLRHVDDASIDAVVTDPPYAEIDRPYGRLTEVAWHELMDDVVEQIRRVLKPTGSAAFVLQPNSERVGRMRPWLFEFVARWARRWNLVQDVWWWNHTTPPTVHCHRDNGLMRPSVKMVVWLGDPDCYRDQASVLWAPSDAMKAMKLEDRTLQRYPSGQTVRRGRIKETVEERGGVTPFNLLPIANTDSQNSGGTKGHGAATPMPLCKWWVRYLCPPGGIVLDPFCGSGTVGLAALDQGRSFAGIEKMEEYYNIARASLTAAQEAKPC